MAPTCNRVNDSTNENDKKHDQMNHFVPSSWIRIIQNSFRNSYSRAFCALYVRPKERKCNRQQTYHRCQFGSSKFFADTLIVTNIQRCHSHRLRTLACYWSINFDTMHVVSLIVDWLNCHFAVWPYLRAVCEIGEYRLVLCGIEWIIRTNPLVAHQAIIHWTNLFFEFLVKKTDLRFIINVTQSYISS